MFTGIVLERGRLLAAPAASGRGGVRLTIGHSRELADRLEIGASLAVSGVCLTLVERGVEAHRGHSAVELHPETQARTTLGGLGAGDEVNLEPALRIGEALGGHWVQGHVDGTAEITARTDHEDHSVFTFRPPPQLQRYLVAKGSVALDGVSLTVASLAEDGAFTVALIPHTLEVTTLGRRRPGQRVNLEVDVLAKYVERLLAGHLPAGSPAASPGTSGPGGAPGPEGDGPGR
ncbi:MAG TPA: riboflavin synthase [Thermoanaerobaculia bacterium]|nr:riboflavin synthase [Thermoanaerobaculia bacterium]